MSKYYSLLVFTGALLVAPLSSFKVSAMPMAHEPATCDSSWFQLTGVTVTTREGIEVFNENLDPGISATDCAGLYPPPQDASNDHPDPNIGLDSNGLLNGEYKYIDGEYFFDPVTEGFIAEGDLQNLNDVDDEGNWVGTSDDPGWFLIAGEENATTSDSEYVQNSEYATIGDEYGEGLADLNLSQVVDVSIKCDIDGSACGKTGYWSIELLDDAWDLLPAYFGDDAIFDHLTFVVSAGSDWGIFDFNTLAIVDSIDGLSYPNVAQPANFKLAGTYDLTLFGKNGADISHWSVHARDPSDDGNEIPLPGTLFLLGSSLLLLRLTRSHH